jgi:hypothetical protein
VIDPLDRIRDANPIAETDADEWFASASPPDPTTLPSGSGEAAAARPSRRAAAAWAAWSAAAAAVVLVIALLVGRGGDGAPDVVVVTSAPVAGSTTPSTSLATTTTTTAPTTTDGGPPPGSEGNSVPGLDAVVAGHPDVFLTITGNLDKPSVAVYKGKLDAARPLLAPFPADRFRLNECPITPAQGRAVESTLTKVLDPLGLSYAYQPNANTCSVEVTVGGATAEQITRLEAETPAFYRFTSAGTVVRTTRPN